ncbi:golgin subfamily A member 2-like [Cololabis saira]|uniref:golgin subfamily A member 2-like n=1 Tax=Cololabis saira TaxID=129043 RepID=UPI002AD38019|nr:golgin subfamily A member 2-like [Cololabis saira]
MATSTSWPRPGHFLPGPAVLQTQELSDQLTKERKDFEQRFSKEQGSMREQLQVHIQTIGILVSEKSELQTALTFTQQAARNKMAETEELNSRLQASKQRVSELERTLSSVSTQQKQSEKQQKELEKERDTMRLELLRLNSASEEWKQRSSELTEQLKFSSQTNAAMKVEVDELHKRLEMADLMLQQCSSSDSSDAGQQIQMLLEEKQQLENINHQLLESVEQLKTERDVYSEQIQDEGRVWKDKTEQLLSQVSLVAEERDRNINQVQELEARILELRNAAALASAERETRESLEPESSGPPGPSEREQALQTALSLLQQEKEAVAEQFQAQLRDNQQFSRLCSEQESRLAELQRRLDSQSEEAEDRRRILEDVQSDKATISRALSQNRALKEQLGELQGGFVKLTNENMELTSAIGSEQHVKKELGRRLAELQEELAGARETRDQEDQEARVLLEQRDQEARVLLEQRDQALLHLQQYSSAYQQMATERESLQQHFLQQREQMEMSQNQLQQEQIRLHQLIRENQQLKLLSSNLGSTRDQGDGVESQSEQENPEKSSIVPESQKETDQNQDQELDLDQDLDQNQNQDQNQDQHSHEHSGGVPEQQLTCPPGGVPEQQHAALQAAMQQLQRRFTSLMTEKAELQERVEELEHRCIQLSGETDTIGEYIALYQNQRAIMKQKHQEKEQYISLLAQDKEEMKAKLAELQDLVMRLVAERNDWFSRYATVANAGPVANASPDLLPVAVANANEQQLDLSTAGEAESMEVVPLAEPSDPDLPGPPNQDGTTRQIMQLLQEIQNPQGGPRGAHRPPFLGENPCIPFFYRPDEQDQVQILVV